MPVIPERTEEVDVLDENQTTIMLILGGSTVKLAFTKMGGKLFLVSNDFRNRWPSYVLRKGWAELRLNEKKLSGKAKLVTDDSRKSEILGGFRTKYGEGYIKHYFKTVSRIVEVDTASVQEQHDGDYFTWLTDEFDNIAYDYDRHIYENSVNLLLRDRSLETMKRVFSGKNRLLEIGCGTGTETLELLRDGFEITAVDISQKMLDKLREKAIEQGLDQNLTLLRGRAGEISKVVAPDPDVKFQGIYSNFGAMNCEPGIGTVPTQISSLLEDGGIFVAGVYNRFCVSEVFLYLATLQFRKAVDRVRNFSLEGHSRFCVDVQSFSVRDFFSYFKPYFKIEKLEGIPVFIPPSNLDSYVRKFYSHFHLLKKIDRFVGARWPFYALGDHFLMTMSKKP